MDWFNIEELWKFYLDKVEITEEELHPIQIKETKQAFCAGCAQILYVVQFELPKLSLDDMPKKMKSFNNQINTFFEEIQTQYEKQKNPGD